MYRIIMTWLGAVLIGYNATIRVWPMVGLNVVLAVINIWYLRRLLTTRHDEQTYQVVEVFRFEGGELSDIQAVTSELPYGMRPHS